MDITFAIAAVAGGVLTFMLLVWLCSRRRYRHRGNESLPDESERETARAAREALADHRAREIMEVYEPWYTYPEPRRPANVNHQTGAP